MILHDLKTHLLGKVGLTSKIGERIYINRAPDRTAFPYILASVVSGQPAYSLAGETGTAQPIIQITAWARDPNGPFQADQVAELVRDKISGFRGSWGNTFVSSCILQNEPLGYSEEPDDDSDNYFHAVQADYMVTHGRAVPTLA